MLSLQSTFLATVLATCLLALPAVGQERDEAGAVHSPVGDAAVPGVPVAEPSTYRSISLRWPIVGDANKNASVRLQYRESGEQIWHEGYPLFRPWPERMSPDNKVDGGWLFAGSVVDLSPGRDYVVRVTLSDPDGVGGDGRQAKSTSREQRIATRSEPGDAIGGRSLVVVPNDAGRNDDGDGSETNPLNGLTKAEQLVEPGDVLILRPGTYRLSNFQISRSGRPGRPIVYRGMDGAVLDGGGAEILLNAGNTSHRWFENLEFRNADQLLRADRASDMVIRRNRFHLSAYGVTSRWSSYAESLRNAVLDNIFLGPTKWPRSKGIEEVYAVELTGAGHVIAYNLFRNIGDAVHNGGRGRQSAIDVYGNEIVTCTDDGIETDYSDTNVRVYRNRITNCYAGISGQPVHGGPVYAFRNIVFNTQYAPFKLHNDTSGLLLFHNTSVRAGVPFNIQPGRETVSNVVTRNNLFVGTRSPALRSTGHMIDTDFDSDGYAWGIGAGDFALWNRKRYGSPEDARHSKQLYRDRGAFSLYVHRTFRKGFLPPADYKTEAEPSYNLPILSRNSQAIDKGGAVPNFGGEFSGAAPDLGCCEAGADLPWFGPRPEK